MIRVLLLVTVLLSGCASSRLSSCPPVTLPELNETLDDRWVTVALVEGRDLRAADVEMGAEWTTYRDIRTSRTHQIPTANIEQIRARGASGGGAGFLIGAVPGLILIGAGVTGEVSAGPHSGGAIEGFAVLGGAALAATGAVVGALIGSRSQSSSWRILYQRPGPPDHTPPHCQGIRGSPPPLEP